MTRFVTSALLVAALLPACRRRPITQDECDRLLDRYVEMQVYRMLAESSAAEHAARMTAMESATSNASDVIDALTLHMNKVRQAAITREIIEVVSGAASAG